MKKYILLLFLSLCLPAICRQSPEYFQVQEHLQFGTDIHQMEVVLNTTTKILVVKLHDLEVGGNVSIFNDSGHLAINVFPDKNTLNVDVSKLKKGSYLVVYGDYQCKFVIK